MFNGAHVVIFSRDAAADRTVLRDVLGLSHVDAGEGWLIFALPPSELACHPVEGEGGVEFYLICDDLAAARAALDERGVTSDEPTDEGWGVLSAFRLPGGSRIGFYQPRHARPG